MFATLAMPVRAAAAVVGLSGGDNHSVFLKDDGRVWGSGINWDGPLESVLSTKISSSTPTLVIITDVAATSVGNGHALFLKTDGTVWVMGENSYGQLGDGTTTERRAPVPIMSGVSAISAGSNYSLFLKTDGTVWASGYNEWGELGDGTSNNRTAPVQVMSDVVAISAGRAHSLFLKTDGTVWATGWGWDGQLGNGDWWGSVNTPVSVMSGVAAISAGGDHSLFLKSDHTLWASGGTVSGGNTPTQVMSEVAAISAGGDHSLFLKTDGTVWASGQNNYGQLGDGSIINRSSPVQVLFPASQYNFAGFQLEHFSAAELSDPALSSSTADPDGDGMTNLLEYALGLDPQRSDSAGVLHVDGSGGLLALRYRRSQANNMTYQVQSTNDLGTPASWSAATVTQGDPDADGWVTASVPLVTPACFLRLWVEVKN